MKHDTIRTGFLAIAIAALLLTPVTVKALTGYNSNTGRQPNESAAERTSLTDEEPRESFESEDEIIASPDNNQHMQLDNLESHIQLWVQALAQEQEFEQWSEASWWVYPMGPGTHSWVVLLQANGEEVGYMIIASTDEGGYQLIEYGAGSSPLFSMHTLYRSLVQQELIPASSYEAFIEEQPLPVTRLYIPPLQGIWIITDHNQSNHYLDAKTGQQLPDITEWLAQVFDETNSETSPTPHWGITPGKLKLEKLHPPADWQEYPLITETAVWDNFDPFIQPNWLRGSGLSLTDFDHWKQAALSPNAHTTYKGAWYGGQALYPLAATGYHLWHSGTPFIRLDHDGSRFIALEAATSIGQFYTSN